MIRLILLASVLLSFKAHAQIFQKKEEEERKGIRLPKYVATKNTLGMIGGIERGQYTFLELGLEKHWKKIRLVNARTIGANANLEYNFGNNVLGYNAGAWIKKGRVDLTYGFNLNYITDFEHSRYGLGPQIGFRLLGLHFVNGYNFLLGDKELKEVNKFYVGLRYYFPLESKTTVENINKRKPTEKKDVNKASIFKSKEDDKPSNDKAKSGKGENKSQKSGKKENRVEPARKALFQKSTQQDLKSKSGSSKKKKEDSSKKKLQENKGKGKARKEEKKTFWDHFKRKD